MKTTTPVIVMALLAAAAAGGYWLGRQAQPQHIEAAAPTASAPKARKLLYYRNPMGLADTSPVPKKDPMGMDYIAVYEGEEADGTTPGTLRINTDKVQKLGVRTEATAMRVLGRTLRASGSVQADERRVSTVTAKFEGYVERLHVNATGQAVAQGQPLFDVYSPELLAAQREYRIAAQGLQTLKDAGPDAQAGLKQLADAALARLRSWDLPGAQLAALAAGGAPQRTVPFPSPVAGIVSEKKALQGMRFMPGEMLYQLTDLSTVWVVADVPEQDMAQVRLGARARVTTAAYPDQALEGRVTFVYPTLKADTRSVPVRVELPNPGLRLKPAMFAQVELAVGSSRPVLTVPDTAVIDTGTRRLVLVQAGEGRYEPREVRTGARGDSHVEITQGLRDGEAVVVAANFLIDAESNLKAVVGAASAPAASAAAVGHKAQGRVDSIDLQAGTLSLAHGPVASLKWPAMTMDFKVANASLLKGLKPGQAVHFEFVERARGDYVVTSIVGH